ncbi:MAG: GEVED domain-containing protein [Bacteroidota bacterium]
MLSSLLLSKRLRFTFLFVVLAFFHASLFAQYCVPIPQFDCSEDWIDDFYTTGGVSNISNLNTGCNGTYSGTFITSTYTYFSTKTCSQMQGQQITLHMQCGTMWVQGFRVWIDWNKNNSFADPGEDVYVSPNASFSIFTVAITVPASATIGTTRMRVQSRYNDVPTLTSCCGTTNYPGETEDYNFTVLAAGPCSGIPTAGTVAGASTCIGASTILSVSGFSIGSGITFQWQQLNGSTWANVVGGTGATTATYITPNLFTNTQYKCLVKCTNSNSTSSTTPYTVVVTPPLSTAPVSGAYVFGATTNTSFNTATNWFNYTTATGYSIASVPPSATHTVIVPAIATCVKALPVLMADASIANLEIQSGAKLALNGFDLTLMGALTGTGTIKGAITSSLNINSNASSTLYFDQSDPGYSNALQNLSLSGTGTISLATLLNMCAGSTAGTVQLSSNKTLQTGGYLRLQSDANGTARIAESGGTISGAITQERYVPGKWSRRWSFLASPVTQSLAAAWQQQIHITGPGTGGSMCTNYTNAGSMVTHSNGFDVTQTQNPSFYTYDALTDNFTPNTTGTNAYMLTPGVGYMALVRGDRNDPVNGGCALLAADDQAANIATDVTLVAKGIVGQGTITKTLYPGYNLVGNPYPCELEFSNFVLDAANSGFVEHKYWTYYPTNSNYTFSTYSAGTSINDATPQIANGQSFLLHNTGNATATITFKESHKSTIADNGNFKTTQAWKERIRIGFLNQQGLRQDEVVIRFGEDALITPAMNTFDVTSLNAGQQWIKSLKDTNALAIQTRPYVVQADTVSLSVHAQQAGTYQFKFSEYQGLVNQEVYLLDLEEARIQNVKTMPNYSFTLAAHTTTSNRFKLLFHTTTAATAKLTADDVYVYPNPTKDIITITDPSLEAGVYQIYVFAITGAEVMHTKATFEKAGSMTLSLKDLAAGMYIVELQQENGLRARQKVYKN